MLRRFLFLLAFLLTSAPASAWSDYGHATIARIAQLEMKPATRRQVANLLARSALLETSTCPARNLAEAATWADCIRRLGDRFSYASSWHYQNIPICRDFDARAECPGGNCLSVQIERNRRLLADRDLPLRERVAALAFLVHLVGDLHMPLHVADRSDRGGGRLPVAYGVIAGRTNLHLAWDVYLAERSISTPLGEARGILAELAPQERMTLREGTLRSWLHESWALGANQAYGSVLADPCGAPAGDRPVITEASTRRLIPAVRLQIARAGLRLARLLDEALAPAPPSGRAS